MVSDYGNATVSRRQSTARVLIAVLTVAAVLLIAIRCFVPGSDLQYVFPLAVASAALLSTGVMLCVQRGAAFHTLGFGCLLLGLSSAGCAIAWFYCLHYLPI